MAKMVNLVWDMKLELESQSTEDFGKILHENWVIKGKYQIIFLII